MFLEETSRNLYAIELSTSPPTGSVVDEYISLDDRSNLPRWDPFPDRPDHKIVIDYPKTMALSVLDTVARCELPCGGSMRERPFRSFATSGSYRRECTLLTLDEDTDSMHPLSIEECTAPLMDAITELCDLYNSSQDVFVCPVTLFDLPPDAIAVFSEEWIMWADDQSLRQMTHFCAGVSKTIVIAQCAEGVEPQTLANATQQWRDEKKRLSTNTERPSQEGPGQHGRAAVEVAGELHSGGDEILGESAGTHQLLGPHSRIDPCSHRAVRQGTVLYPTADRKNTLYFRF